MSILRILKLQDSQGYVTYNASPFCPNFQHSFNSIKFEESVQFECFIFNPFDDVVIKYYKDKRKSFKKLFENSSLFEISLTMGAFFTVLKLISFRVKVVQKMLIFAPFTFQEFCKTYLLFFFNLTPPFKVNLFFSLKSKFWILGIHWIQKSCLVPWIPDI